MTPNSDSARHSQRDEEILQLVDGRFDRVLDCLLGGYLHIELVRVRIDGFDAKGLGAELQEALRVLSPYVAHPGGEDDGEAGAVRDLGVQCG